MEQRQTTKPTPPKKRINGALVALAVVILAVAALLIGRQYFGPGHTPLSSQRAAATTGPRIGGPFTLVDHTGKTVTDADFRGRFMLVFFGYTYCPDVCPISLSRNSQALDLLGERADKIVPILITIDPERDTPEQMAPYVAVFGPRFVGLTGSKDQVAAAAKAYGIYYAKAEQPGAAPGQYLMDHSSVTYLIGPDGRFLRHFRQDMSPEDMAEQLRALL